MNQVSNSERMDNEVFISSVTARTIRQWCAPETVLAVTNLVDEETILFHAIRYVGHKATKFILVHVLQDRRKLSYGSNGFHFDWSDSSAESALNSLNRIARQLRWVGISCESLLLRGSPAEEIAALAKARRVDRIVMTAWCEEKDKDPVPKALAEVLLDKVGIPICIVGQSNRQKSQKNQPSGSIMLAVSLDSDSRTLLAFASRLAQEYNSKLVVMHIFGPIDGDYSATDRTPTAVATRLPAEALKSAELSCPLEIAIREGDPASEILRFSSRAQQDFIILGPTGRSHAPQRGHTSLVHRVITEAHCPVVILGKACMESAKGY
ncbi:MAG TPA: universal stress protein [Chroococcales cyanobacterium]